MSESVEPSGRPVDVDTGFWLWVGSLPLLTTGHIIDLVASNHQLPAAVLALSVLFVVILAAVVLTFQILMRQGYRWARTLLTGGGVATIVYVATNLFTVERATPEAMIYAVSGILGTVLIAGGVFLLHRKDAHAFFTR